MTKVKSNISDIHLMDMVRISEDKFHGGHVFEIVMKSGKGLGII